MDTRCDLSPWLAQVYVAPEFRGCGIGSALVRAVACEAASLGVHRLYLYTGRNRESFYAKLGWTVREYVEYKGRERVIMETGLAV
jgi:GNAT superfamily N-acetyltransferase